MGDNNKAISNTRFYLEHQVDAWLVERFEDRKNANLTIQKGTTFTFDVVEQPFFFHLDVDEEAINVALCVRSELGAMVESADISLAIYTNGDKPKVIKNTGRIGGNAGVTVMYLLKAAAELANYVAEKNMVEQVSNIDTETEGFLVSVTGEELSLVRVSGKKRPDMACTTLFGGVQMCRPYSNEIMDYWMDEMLPIEEKIELAEDGDEEMMEQVAIAYLNGDDEVDSDPEKAVYWFTKLAELDNSDAQFNLGLHHAKGHGTKRDFEKALYWMQKAADNGDVDAPVLVEKYTKAVEAMKKIDSGDAQAQADLAGVLMALAGSLEQAGTGDDYAMAFDLAQKSAQQNNGDGIWALALAYEHGRGVAKDVKKAAELYQKGADVGHAPSMHSLACYYLRGDVLEKDERLGFELSLKSAEAGYGLAMRTVGSCYQFGNGVEDDMKLAIEWYEKTLEVMPDPELARKVSIFKMLEETAEETKDDWTPPEGYEEALKRFTE